MRYLVDANVLSEPTRPQPDPSVVEWLRENEAELAVDPIILGEVKFGILLLPKGARRARLESWFAAGVERIQCLSWDASTGLRWARLLAELRASGRAMPVKDSLIAATALTHGLTVATRNRADFEKAGVGVEDPFSPSRRRLRLQKGQPKRRSVPSLAVPGHPGQPRARRAVRVVPSR